MGIPGKHGRWAILALWPVLSIAATPLDTEQALHLQVNRDGLSRVASEIKASALSDISGAPLPDINQEVSLGIKVSGTGIRYGVEFGDLSLVPEAGSLGVALAVARVRLDVDRMRFSKKIITEISTTCVNTAVEVKDIPVSARLVLGVAGGMVTVEAPELSTPIHEDRYQVHGPGSCSGALGIGSLVKLVVREVLKRSRGTIEAKLQEAARGMIPELGRVLTATARRRLPIDLDEWLGLGRAAFSIVTAPRSASVSEAGIDVVLSASAENGNSRERNGDVAAIGDGSPLGIAGVNPALLSEALSFWLPQGTPWIGLTEALAPGVSQALSVEHLQAIWPDLRQASLSAGHLRAKIRLPRAPSVRLGAGDGLLVADLPTEWALQIQQEGRWKDYFTLRLAFTLDAAATIAENKLAVSLSEGSSVSVSGEWAQGYTPADPRFEQELAEAVFAALVEIVVAQGPLVGIDVPRLELASGNVSIANPRVHAPYLRVDLVSAD